MEEKIRIENVTKKFRSFFRIPSYKWQGYGNGPSMAYVYSVFAIVIGACTILSYLGIRKKDLNFVEEI
jgi:hypothetical protein